MNVEQVTGAIPQVLPVEPVPSGGAAATDASAFAGLLRVLRAADAPQQAAEAEALRVAEGRSGNLHDAMLAMRQAEISFQLALTVRNRLVQAYEELMRTQV